MRRSESGMVVALSCALAALACSESAPGAIPAGSGGGGSGTPGTGGALIVLPHDASRPGGDEIPVPTNFVDAELGGFALGGPVTGSAGLGAGSSGADGGSGCDVLVGVVRDFKGINEPGGHPDFEAFDGRGPTPGLVSDSLGPDRKPVYASRCEAFVEKSACPHGQMTTSGAAFDQWYRYAEGVNQPRLLYLRFDRNGDVYTFSSRAFFPMDDAGWGNSPHKSRHNFGFTTELHTTFVYRGGEVFTFTGDDDVWVFVNGKLAIDLGGLHPQESLTLDLDVSATALGLVHGSPYALDLFHAERHSASSNFRVDTTLGFTTCGVVVPDPPR